MAVTKESIFGYKPKPTAVEVPEWGGTVYVRVISGNERDDYEAAAIKGRGKNAEMNLRGVRGRLVALCLVDESGNRIFADTDAETVGNLPADVIDRVFDVAQRVNGITKADVDDLAGKSVGAPSEGSGST